MFKTFVGTDIVEIADFDHAIKTWKDKFIQRLYTEEEIKSCQKRINTFAAHFAAKEAVIKALGGNIKGFNWKNIEVLSNEDGAPYIKISGTVLKRANDLGIRSFSVSLSHSKNFAIAFVLGYVE
jgi:holo-[acyl-carrier protein] synthase